MELEVNLEIIARGEKVKRHIVIKTKTTVPLHLRRLVSFIGIKGKVLDLPKRDMLIEPFDEAIIMFTHLVDAETNAIMFQNDTDTPKARWL